MQSTQPQAEDGDVATYERKGTLTVSTGTPDAYPALVHEPVDLLHEELGPVLVLLAEDEHRHEGRYEGTVWHGKPIAREGLLGSAVSTKTRI